jgi:uncharacterized membrane protein AbrB (regulator of aidB expression)
MTVAALLQGAGYLTVTLPKGLLLLGYGAIGLSIGLRFSRDLLRSTMRAIPEMLAATFALIGLCGVSAWVLVRLPTQTRSLPIWRRVQAGSTLSRSSRLAATLTFRSS